MRIIITEEKSSNVMTKLHNLKKIATELAECFEECKEESSSRSRHYEDEDEYDKYSSKRRTRKDYDDDDYDDEYDSYKRSSYRPFRGSRY
jgi:hypothetical protein